MVAYNFEMFPLHSPINRFEISSKNSRIVYFVKSCLKIGDYTTRNLVILTMVVAQIIITTLWWMVHKCWDWLPFYILLPAILVIIFDIGAVFALMPCAVELGEASSKYISKHIAALHTFNRRYRNYYWLLKWKSEQMLAIRFGVQFIVSKQSAVKYFEVLMDKLTNAILLINP